MSSSILTMSDAMEVNMRVSEQQDDFVVLTGSHVVSPSRQLMIKFGRFDLEMNGVQHVAVYFDRTLKADRLMMPASESPYYITPSHPTAEVPLIPFLSAGQRRVSEFGFASRVESKTLIFLLNYDERSAYLMLKELARLPKHVTHDRPAELMKLILGGVARLRSWPIRELSGGAPIDTIELRLNHKFVSSIEREIELGLPACDPTELPPLQTGRDGTWHIEDLLAAWEVAQ